MNENVDCDVDGDSDVDASPGFVRTVRTHEPNRMNERANESTRERNERTVRHFENHQF